MSLIFHSCIYCEHSNKSPFFAKLLLTAGCRLFLLLLLLLLLLLFNSFCYYFRFMFLCPLFLHLAVIFSCVIIFGFCFSFDYTPVFTWFLFFVVLLFLPFTISMEICAHRHTKRWMANNMKMFKCTQHTANKQYNGHGHEAAAAATTTSAALTQTNDDDECEKRIKIISIYDMFARI